MKRNKKGNAKDALTRCKECTRAGAQDRGIEYVDQNAQDVAEDCRYHGTYCRGWKTAMQNESGRNTEIIFHMNRDAKDAMTECTGDRTMGDKMHMNIKKE
jgi:hypothetical protein